jgi:hypothetical protein
MTSNHESAKGVECGERPPTAGMPDSVSSSPYGVITAPNVSSPSAARRHAAERTPRHAT